MKDYRKFCGWCYDEYKSGQKEMNVYKCKHCGNTVKSPLTLGEKQRICKAKLKNGKICGRAMTRRYGKE